MGLQDKITDTLPILAQVYFKGTDITGRFIERTSLWMAFECRNTSCH
jgi:hypothetical protein